MRVKIQHFIGLLVLVMAHHAACALPVDSMPVSDTAKVNMLLRMASNLEEDKTEQAIRYFNQALFLAEEIGDEHGIAEAAWKLGSTYSVRGEYQKAIEYLINALREFEDIDDQPKVAECLRALGLTFFKQESFDKSLEYHYRALLIYQRLDDKLGMARQNGNIGNLYLYQSSFAMANEHYTNSLEVFKEIGDQSGIAKCYGALASVKNKEGDYNEALKFYLKAKEIFEEQDDQLSILTTLNNIGSNYRALGQPEQAIEHLLAAKKMGEGISANEMLKRVYMNLADVYAELGDYKNAYEYESLYAVKEDELNNLMVQKQIAEVEARYKMARHQSELELITKDNALKQADLEKSNLERAQLKTMLYGICIGFCLLVVMVLVVYRSLQQRKKAFQIVLQQSKDIRKKNQDLRRLNEEITYQKDQIQSSIEYAKRIQDAILPSNVKFKGLLPESFVLFKPRDIVSGDFYWISEVRSKVIVAAIDCTGHGVPGAFLSMIGNEQLNRIVNQQGTTDANLILQELNRGITRALKQDETMNKDGMDIALLVIDRATGHVQFSGAKNPLLYIDGAEIVRIKGDNQAVGGMWEEEKRTYTLHEIKVEKPTVFYIYSDGFQDQFGGPKGKKYNTVRFRALLEENYQLPMQEQMNLFNDEIVDWMMETDEMQVDDILLIGIKVDPVRSGS